MSATVQAAVAAVIADLPAIGKGDRSNEGYSYRGIEAVTKEVQPLLAKHGVVIAPRSTITDVRPSPAMKDGWTDVFMQVEWLITGPDGSTITAQTTGIGRDRADKGANKAQTQAYKYLLLHLLCIADAKDDSDSHSYEDGRAEEMPKARRQKPTQAGPALPAATDTQYIAITSLIDDLTDKEKSALMAWWTDQGHGSLKAKNLSAASADAVLVELERILTARQQPTEAAAS